MLVHLSNCHNYPCFVLRNRNRKIWKYICFLWSFNCRNTFEMRICVNQCCFNNIFVEGRKIWNLIHKNNFKIKKKQKIFFSRNSRFTYGKRQHTMDCLRFNYLFYVFGWIESPSGSARIHPCHNNPKNVSKSRKCMHR